MPLVAARLLSIVGEPGYISFLRFTAGVASSVFLRTFWHFVQTILGFFPFSITGSELRLVIGAVWRNRILT